MKKILIAITDAGNAHKVAAEAVKETFSTTFPGDFEIVIVDMLKEADVEPFNTSDISYSLFSQNTFLDNINIGLSKLLNTSLPFDVFKSYVVGRLKQPFLDILAEHKPDIVICNHPIPAMVLSTIRTEQKSFKYVINVLDLVTFFKPLADINADLITAPTQELATKIAAYVIPMNKIEAPLFPFHPRLKSARNKKEVSKELGFDPTKPIILITGGGLGLKTMRDGIAELAKRKDIQLIIIAGKLQSFKRELEDLYLEKENVKIFGFVNNMQDYLNSSDIVIAKPGATTIMECELFGKKAIFTKRVGHVEMGHDQYIKNNPRFRYIGNDWNLLEGMVNELLDIDFKKKKSDRSLEETETIVKKIKELL